MNAVTFTEREAIERMMSYIEKEKERLSNQYVGLLDRLRELDQIEKLNSRMGTGLPEGKVEVLPVGTKLTLEEAIKAHNELSTPDSKKDFDEKEWSPCEWAFAEEEQDVKKFNEYLAKAEEIVETGEPGLIPRTEIEALKDKDEKNKPVKVSSQRDVKVVTQFIKAILKEAGVPIRTSELIKRLEEAGINVSSPYVLLSQASQYDPKIQKPKFGFYQYNFSA